MNNPPQAAGYRLPPWFVIPCLTEPAPAVGKPEESSRIFWIPAFAGMMNSRQAAGNTTPRDLKISKNMHLPKTYFVRGAAAALCETLTNIDAFLKILQSRHPKSTGQ